MAYSDDAVRAKLSSLNESQDSIVSVAQWIMFHRRHADRTATLWSSRLQDSPTPPKKLNLVYLANEVVQQSRARARQEFQLAFEPLIADATSLAYKGANQDIQGKLRRVVEVWRQRSIFDVRTQDQIEKRLDDIDKQKGSKGGIGGGGRLGGSLFGGGGGVAPELEGVNKSLTALSKAEAASKAPVNTANAEYEKQTDPDAPLPSAPMRASKLQGLAKQLRAARGAVEASIRARKELLAGLEKLIENHRASIAAEEDSSTDLAGKIDRIEATVRDVEDSIMRGQDGPTGTLNGGSNGAEPERPEPEGFTPPPQEEEAPDVDDHAPLIGDGTPMDMMYTSSTGADPIQEQPPNMNEPPPAFEPTPALDHQDPSAAAANEFLASLKMPQVRQASGEIPATATTGTSGDPRLKRRKMSHRSNDDIDDEIFGSSNIGGVDEDGISAMLGQ